MTLDLSAVGQKTNAIEQAYDWKTTVLYALGIGAKRDELPYLFEGKGPKVYPTFAVVPTYAVLMDLLGRTKGNLAMVVHGGQMVKLHRPFPSEGKMKTVGTLAAIYDMKKMAQAILRTTTEVNGELVSETEWSIIFRGEGGWGGDPPPKREVPKAPDGAAPDFTVEEATSPEQALLYRLSGDPNPLHADPDFAAMVGFPQGPILHGLATYGYVARAIVKAACGGDGDKMKSFTAQFRKPVWPGETIRTVGYRVAGGVVVEAYAADRPDVVVSGGFAEIA